VYDILIRHSFAARAKFSLVHKLFTLSQPSRYRRFEAFLPLSLSLETRFKIFTIDVSFDVELISKYLLIKITLEFT